MNGPGAAFDVLQGWIGGDLPGPVITFGWIFFWIVFVLTPFSALLSWAERKVGADFQARVGPNRVGALGSLQGLADFVKLLTKRADQPKDESASLRASLVAMMTLPVVCAAIVPATHVWVFADSDIASVLPLFLTALASLASLLYGLERDHVAPSIGAVRLIAQWVAYFFCALICLSVAGLQAGSLSWSALVDAQGFAPWHWAIVGGPVAPIVGGVFFLSGLGLLGLAPLNTSTAERDLSGGLTHGVSGARILMLLTARRFSLLMWAVLTVLIFLGAWRLPPVVATFFNESEMHALRAAAEVLWVLSKVSVLLLLTHWVASVVPRLRPDQSTAFAWFVLAPCAILSLIFTGLWIGVSGG